MTENKVTEYGLSKEERLNSKKQIDSLFQGKNDSFIAYPLRIVYQLSSQAENEDNVRSAILISVPKRKFKRAVKRNRIKRLVRESFRFNKQALNLLLASKALRVDIALIFLDENMPKFEDIELAIKKMKRKIAEKISKDEEDN